MAFNFGYNNPPTVVESGRIVAGIHYTDRQLEHIGDAFLSLVVRRALCALCTYQAEYFYWAGRIVTNANLRTIVWPDGRTLFANAAEVEIGIICLTLGYPEAIASTQSLIQTSTVWQEFEKHWKETKEDAGLNALRQLQEVSEVIEARAIERFRGI